MTASRPGDICPPSRGSHGILTWGASILLHAALGLGLAVCGPQRSAPGPAPRAVIVEIAPAPAPAPVAQSSEGSGGRSRQGPADRGQAG